MSPALAQLHARSGSLRRALLASVLPLLCAAPALADWQSTRLIDRREYTDRLRAMRLGEVIANWTGIPVEGRWQGPPFATDANWGDPGGATSPDPAGAPNLASSVNPDTLEGNRSNNVRPRLAGSVSASSSVQSNPPLIFPWPYGLGGASGPAQFCNAVEFDPSGVEQHPLPSLCYSTPMGSTQSEPLNDTIPFQIIDWSLPTTMQASGARLRGVPGGGIGAGAPFVTIAELDTLDAPSPPLRGSFDLSADGVEDTEDLDQL
ncbi:MAG TPA: hypothetical protein PL072_10870 [Phycisphaerales bacterium]|nr:hypothetical protein [Phycisphaerales bacterium]